MPWYWTDDLARVLAAEGKLDEVTVTQMVATPVALRSEESTLEAAAQELLQEDDPPLAA